MFGGFASGSPEGGGGGTAGAQLFWNYYFTRTVMKLENTIRLRAIYVRLKYLDNRAVRSSYWCSDKVKKVVENIKQCICKNQFFFFCR